ncbi:MAG TPA: PhoH family protein [Acholeplasmataceae bacterium]|nr:PhoH family protein [Acholeplasmataceae bacterium]
MTLERQIDHVDAISKLVGSHDRNLKVFKQYMNVTVSLQGKHIVCDADDHQKDMLETIFHILIDLAEHQFSLTERDVMYVIKSVERNQADDLLSLYKNRKPIYTNYVGKQILAKTFHQQDYIDAISKNDLTFGVGPAGTGKTFLGVTMALQALKMNQVKKIILTRPVVEAGENLGFLPGDLKEKIDPYLIPLYDALYDMLGLQQTNTLIERQIIEIAPLAFMRGRTLERAFIILDEAQNTTVSQMKMFLTRLGFSSKMLITGDPSQTDLPKGVSSGLHDALSKLKGVKDINIVQFDHIDVIRHPLVQRILERYEQS